MTTREFHVGDILSITTGRLVSPRHMDGVQDILSFMAGEPLWTHQLPRVSRECAPSLREQFPDLAAVEAPEDFGGEADVYSWLDAQVAAHGETRQVAPLAAEDHTSIGPLTELRQVAPQSEIITVVLPDGDH